MQTLPAATLRLHASTGEIFASVHFVQSDDPKKVKGECIFMMDPAYEDSRRPEIRWLEKRRFERVGEHRFRVDARGLLIIHSGDFELELESEEDPTVMRTTPSGPQISATWDL